MIELTNMDNGKKFVVSIHEIQAVKEGAFVENGRTYPYTDLFFGKSEKSMKCVRVVESAQEIGRKMIRDLTDAGEDINVTESGDNKKGT